MSSTSTQALTGSSRRIVEQVVRFGPSSRAELARVLELSRASLTRLTKPLLRSGLLEERGQELQAATGRPARLLDVVDDAHAFVGVNLTGDTAFGVLTGFRARPRRSRHVALPSSGPDEVVAAVADLVADLVESTFDSPGQPPGMPGGPLQGVGVSLGGLVEERGTVVRAPFLGWTERIDVADRLSAVLGAPVVVDNDLLSVTRAEQWFGIGREVDHFALLTIGAGVGFGLVVHDQIVDSPDAGLGLIADLPLDPTGPRCRGGHRGCGNAMLTTGAIRRQVAVALDRDVTWAEVLDLAGRGEPGVREVVADAGRALGRLVATIANIAMPRVVVLAGEGVGLARIAADDLQAGIDGARDSRAAPVDLRIRGHDFHSWARGAAVAAIEDYVDNRITAVPRPARLSA